MNLNPIYWKYALIFSIVVGIAVGGTIVEGPTDITVGLDRIAVFRCNVNKSDDEEVHWLFDGQVLFINRDIVEYSISPADEERFSVIGLSENDFDLQIKRVTLADARQYTCKIQPKNLGGNTTEQSAYLQIHRAPRKTNPDCTANGKSSTFDFEVGTEVLFACQSARGIPDVTLSWIDREHNSSVDSNLDNTSAIYIKRYFRKNLSVEDTGKILTCKSFYSSDVIGNRSGSCNIGPLNILYAPESVTIDGNGYAVYGQTLVLTCSASGGNPETKTYTWAVYPEIPADRMQASSNILNIHNINASDNGLLVKCSATNGIGDSLMTNVTLGVGDKPITPSPSVGSMTTKESKSGNNILFPHSIGYILILILAGLICLLGSVCTVLYLLIRKRRRTRTDSLESLKPPLNMSHLTSIPNWIADDTASVKSWRSEPGFSFFDRGDGSDIELQALKAGRYKSQDNISRMSNPYEYLSPSSHMYYRPESPPYLVVDTPVDMPDLPGNVEYYGHPDDRVRLAVSPRHRPGGRPHRFHRGLTGAHIDDGLYDDKRFTKHLVRTGSDRSASGSPVIRYKHKRLPFHSPMPSPLSSPARRPYSSRRPHLHPGRTGQEAEDDLQFEYRKFDDAVKDLQDALSDEQAKNDSSDPTKVNGKDPRLRLWLYQQGLNGKYLAGAQDNRTNSNEEYDDDDVFVIVDDKDGTEDEGYCSVHGYGSACGCDTVHYGKGGVRNTSSDHK